MIISFIELDFHHDVVDGFCRTFQNSEIKINFFIKKTVYSKIENYNYIKSSNFKWFIYSIGSRTEFLNKNIDEINNSNCVFINTLSSEPHAYLTVDFKPIVILRVHNVNKLFRPFSFIKIPFTFFYLWKAFSYIIREGVLGGYFVNYKKIQRLPDYFSFPDEGIKDYVIKNKLIDINKIAPSFSLKVFEPYVIKENIVDYFSITIIGGLDKRRRNYESILNTFAKLVPQLNKKIVLTLLGKSSTTYGQKIVKEFKLLENHFFKIISFEDMVPQNQFDEIISNTNLILSPINVDTIIEIYSEKYGETKISGSIHDSIRFPIFTIIPSTYFLDNEKSKYFDFYDEEIQLFEKLKYYLSNQDVVNQKTQNYKRFVKDKYAIDNVRAEFVDFINHQIDLNIK